MYTLVQCESTVTYECVGGMAYLDLCCISPVFLLFIIHDILYIAYFIFTVLLAYTSTYMLQVGTIWIGEYVQY